MRGEDSRTTGTAPSWSMNLARCLAGVLVAGVAASHAMAAPSEPPVQRWECQLESECVTGFVCERGSCQDRLGPFNGEPIRLMLLPAIDGTQRSAGSRWLRDRFTDLLELLLAAAGPFETLVAKNGPVVDSQVILEALSRKATYIVVPELTVLKGNLATFEIRFHDPEWEDVDAELGTSMTIDLNQMVLPAQEWRNLLMQRFTGAPGVLGARLAVVRKVTPGVKELYQLVFGAPDVTALTSNGSLNLLPSWAPDGRIAFTSFAAGRTDVHILGQEAAFSAQPGFNSGVDWTRDGKRAVLTLNVDDSSEIYEVNPTTGAIVRRLTNSPSIDTAPSFSPDGTRIVFVSDRDGGPQLFLMNADGSGVRRLSQSGSYNCNPDWHPFGPWVVYASQTGSGFDIRVINVDTGQDRVLVGGRGRNEDPDWSPDGKMVAFTYSRRSDPGQDVYAVTANGRTLQRLTFDGGPYSAPVWDPKPLGNR